MADEFEAQRALLLLSYDDGIIDEEELCLFFVAIEEDEKREVHDAEVEPLGPRLDLDSMSQTACVDNFRFTQAQIREMCALLHLPDEFRHVNRTVWTNLEGLCVVLRRLSYPCRLRDLVKDFGRGTSDLSIIFNYTCKFIENRWLDHFRTFHQAAFLNQQRLETYAQAIGENRPLKNCWGFIDGTVRGICKPIHHQRPFFNGHKRHHAVKYQSVVAPDGLIVHLFGPLEGRRHDSGVLRESNLLATLTNLPALPDGGVYCIYGDPAYPLRPQLMVPYPSVNITPEQHEFNTAMSSARIAVEWAFGKVVQFFAFVDYKKNQKILLQPVASHYFCAVLFTNCHTCFNGSEASKYFGVQPPTLQEYLA